jgi:hypothetical protein
VPNPRRQVSGASLPARRGFVLAGRLYTLGQREVSGASLGLQGRFVLGPLVCVCYGREEGIVNELGEEIMRVLQGVRDNKISTTHAHKVIGERVQLARQALAKGSGSLILLDILEDSANGYMNLIVANPDEPIIRFDGALQSVRRKAERACEEQQTRKESPLADSLQRLEESG